MILAQRANWERLGDRFSGNQAKMQASDLLMIVAVVVGVLLLLWMLHKLAKWQESCGRRPNPNRLFQELCRAHRLNGWERKALRALAEATGAAQPAEVFVKPECFTKQSMAIVCPEEPMALETLKRKLFAGS